MESSNETENIGSSLGKHLKMIAKQQEIIAEQQKQQTEYLRNISTISTYTLITIVLILVLLFIGAPFG